MHAEPRELRFQDHTTSIGPGARFRQRLDARAVRHRHAMRARQSGELPLAVQRAQPIERIGDDVQLAWQRAPMAREVEHFLAGRQQHVDAFIAHDPGKRTDESTRIETR